jgi:nucleoid DNA-binding protein
MKHSAVITELLNRAKKKVTDTSHFKDRLQVADLERLGGMVTALEDLAVNRNPKSTPEAHKLMLDEKSKQLTNIRKQIESSLYQRLGETYEDILPKAYLESGLKGSEFAPEIRNSLKSLPKGERLQALKNAIDMKHGDVIHAIQDAPELLTGISKQEAKDAFQDYLQRHSPTYKTQVDNSESIVIQEGLNILKAVERAEKEGFNPKELEEIREAEERHEKSFTAFENSKNAY